MEKWNRRDHYHRQLRLEENTVFKVLSKNSFNQELKMLNQVICLVTIQLEFETNTHTYLAAEQQLQIPDSANTAQKVFA